ncbi:MAG: AAA family ATPase, partial [Pyrinomonadaceae bacterium]
MIHLRSIDIHPAAEDRDGFPFDLPFVRNFRALEFKQPVTFLVGENGSGKSTLLEALAAAVGSITVGRDDIARDDSLSAARTLGAKLNLAWRVKTRKGFFLRAEDFFNFAMRVNRSVAELHDIEDEFAGYLKGYALALAQGVVRGQRGALTKRYGENADARSHGESFLHVFRERFVPGGLYLLDEPEAPLSPQRQLAFLALLMEMVELDAQFIIATHSPILMAYPKATILSFDQVPIKKVKYAETEHVSLTKAFLNDP